MLPVTFVLGLILAIVVQAVWRCDLKVAHVHPYFLYLWSTLCRIVVKHLPGTINLPGSWQVFGDQCEDVRVSVPHGRRIYVLGASFVGGLCKYVVLIVVNTRYALFISTGTYARAPLPASMPRDWRSRTLGLSASIYRSSC